MRAALALALALAPLAAAEGVLLLDVAGELLAGTAGVGVGAPQPGAPAVSLATHALSWRDCARELLVSFSYASRVALPHGGEQALLQVELREADGALVGSWLAAHGSLVAATDELPPLAYRLRVFHLAGGPVDYHARVEGYTSGCA